MRAAAALLIVGALASCSDPPPPSESPPPSTTEDGIRVRVGGREVVVHCAVTCPATEAELAQLSSDCLSNPGSGPHRVATSGPVLTLGCCQEATLAYDRACGHEQAGCGAGWQSRCEGMQPRVAPIDDDERGVSTERGTGR